MTSAGTCVVLGGGISGLAAAYRLAQIHPSPKRILLFEAGSRVGGWIHSTKNEDGVVFEHGPRTMRPVGESGTTTLNLLEELQLRDQVINVPHKHPSSLNRYIYLNSKLVRLPLQMSAVFKTLPPFRRPLLAAGLRDLFTAKNTEEDESIFNFISRRLGPDVAEFVIDPVVRGVCAGDAREISVKLLLKTLKDWELQYGRISLGALASAFKKSPSPSQPLSDLAKQAKLERWPVWSLTNGLQTLPNALAEKGKQAGVEICMEAPCTGLEFRNDGNVVVRYKKEELLTSKIISALPSFKLAELVQQSHPNLASLLQSIECVSVGLVNLEYSGRKLSTEAFGFLVPSSQNLPILGVVYDTCSFPQGDRTILTCMMGGRWFKSLFGDQPTQQQLLDTALTHIESILGIKESPNSSQVHILRQCIPQYVVGHYDKVNQIRSYIRDNKLGLELIGASFDGISVNDCIHNSIRTVNQMILKH